MKKKFVKVALLSVLTCGLPATFTSCDDDGWKDRTNVLDQEMAEKGELIDKLSDQINTLNTQIAQYKAEGEAAQKAADAAMAAAKDAQKAGDDAMAAAKAADASAQLAAQAAAEAKEEAAKALKANYEDLKALIDANAKEIAANKALIEGNKALIEQYKGLIDGNTVKINDNAGAIAKILESLKSYTTNDQLADVVKDLNEKLEAAGVKSDNAIAELNGTVAGINAAITALNGQAEALGLDITNLKKATDEQLGTLEANLLAKVEAEAALRADGDKALQDQIDALKKELANLEIASNLEQFTKFIAETNTQLEALKKYDEKLTNDLSTLAGQVSAAENLIKENQGKIATLTKDLKDAADKATANAKAISDQAVLVKKNADAIATLNTSVEELKTAINKLNTETVAGLNGHLATIDGQIEGINTSIEGLTNRLNSLTPYIITMTMEQLRGLVFIPNTFVGGIESALSYNMVYNTLTKVNPKSNTYSYTVKEAPKPGTTGGEAKDVTYKVSDYKTWALKNSGKTDNFHPVTEVSYHMNPTSAKVEFKDLKIVSNDAEIISRASSANIALDGSYNDNKGLSIADGVLTVAINGDAPLYDASSNKKMPVFALQAKVYSEKERDAEPEVITVTSDYAMFAQMDITPGEIVINQEKFFEIYGAAQANLPKTVWKPVINNSVVGLEDVFNNIQTVNVAWNGSADLLSIMNITYTDNQRGKEGAWLTPEEWGKFNLKMNFSLVDYTIGASTVSESSWASIDPETGVITPCVNGDASKQSTDALGHMPLVYITVTEGENVVLQGFIRVKITPTADDYKTSAIAYENVDFDCNNSISNATTDASVLNMMLSATGLSKDVFLAHYSPALRHEMEVDANTPVDPESDIMVQYQNNNGVWSDVTGIGDVHFATLMGRDVDYYFVWDLDTEAKQIAYEKANHTGTTYVCFQSDNADIYPYVYLPLNVTVNAKPVVKVGDKMEARWFRDNTTALLNVPQPTNNTQIKTIKTVLNQLWQNNTPKFTWVSGSPKDIAPFTANYKYYFPAENNRTVTGTDYLGRTYTITYSVVNKNNPCLIGCEKVSNSNMGNHALLVNDANSEYNNTVLKVKYTSKLGKDVVYEGTDVLATLDPVDGEIALAENMTARKLINLFGSLGGENRPEALLDAIVAMVPYSNCEIATELENASFYATFLRPINIAENKGYDFTDAEANGDPIGIYKLLNFSDWRDVHFTGENQWLYGYYNVISATPDFSRMKTNAGTVDTDPDKFVVDSSVSAAFKVVGASDITYSNVSSTNNTEIMNAVKAGFGNIVYNNTDLNVKTYKVQIPFTITYGMGTFEVWVECTINSTKPTNP